LFIQSKEAHTSNEIEVNDKNVVSAGRKVDDERRRLLAMVGALAAGSAMAGAPPISTAATENASPPRRILTGRDAAGKSVFKSIDVTPQVVEFAARPGLTFYELYGTKGVPRVTGQELDPALTEKGRFPKPGDSWFRMVMYPPRLPEGTPANPAAYKAFIKELDEKIPGMADHFEPDVPGMHTSESVDYGIVVRGEMILELDDGKTVHLRQGDCVVQNGTRHRWRNPLAEPCLMAFILIGGVRGS
jgi:mannose-6-phosphate isomerase-like protein (cupin superfamily)